MDVEEEEEELYQPYQQQENEQERAASDMVTTDWLNLVVSFYIQCFISFAIFVGDQSIFLKLVNFEIEV